VRRAVAAAVLLVATLLAAGCQAGTSEPGTGASAQLSSAEATLDRLEHDVDTDGGG